MMAKVFHTGTHLAVETAYSNREACQSIPGGRWKPEIKAWIYPATPSAARTIHQTFHSGQAVWSEEAASILLEAEAIAEAQHLKTSADLPEIPLSKTKAWPHQKSGFWYAVELLGGLPQ